MLDKPSSAVHMTATAGWRGVRAKGQAEDGVCLQTHYSTCIVAEVLFRGASQTGMLRAAERRLVREMP